MISGLTDVFLRISLKPSKVHYANETQSGKSTLKTVSHPHNTNAYYKHLRDC